MLYYVNDISNPINVVRLEAATSLKRRAGQGKRGRQGEEAISFNNKFYITVL